ncbi:SpoIIE family protein phosphatase [Terriglobus roseus]|uniref:Anti-sigma regulatory factor (Ser/Thr protein kinase) n=1 Tax=Terriglobus roseus TaxID=392734 RepID=A0A1H4MUM0_9BACT|nr:SpoIIE family protein phosphatase [Terriglobus roseus]SEB86215.1 Anti-sigma regulatory factor (Ser/Thr protein kinase) [Terriglobus roseus]
MSQIHSSTAITDQSSVGEARRTALQHALALGFDEERRSNIGIAVTEMATNALIHGQGGEILLCPSGELNGPSWLDVLALDAGQGIRDMARAMEDGFSTAGTAGQGLGAVKRLADETSLFSIEGKGTVNWARFHLGSLPVASQVGVVSIPVKGETKCGDGYVLHLDGRRSLYMVVDGLGHGAGANEAALEAMATVRQYSGDTAAELLLRSHEALKKTRGAAMSVAIVDHERKICTYAGVGNVTGVLIAGSSSRTMVSQNGTLGAVLPRNVQEYTYPVEPNTLLLMFSDGLNTRSELGSYAGVQHRHPMMMAGLLYRDFTRRRDDATVMVAPVGRAPEVPFA